MGYPHLVLEEKINGINVNLVGVTHTRDFFHEYEDFFREQINNAPAIFLEDGPKGFTHEFDEEIAKVAQETGRPIYIPEPNNVLNSLAECVQFGGGLYLATNSLKPKGSISRRYFLKKGGTATLGLYLALGSAYSRALLQRIRGDVNSRIDDALSYSTLLDYRNLVAAENLERASNVLKLEGQTPYLIGAAHIEGIHAYLRNPGLRKKRILYLPQDLGRAAL